MCADYYPEYSRPPHHPRVPWPAVAGHDKFVTTRGEQLSPAALLEAGHCNKIQTRRSVSSPHLAISDHDQHVTERRGPDTAADSSQDQTTSFQAGGQQQIVAGDGRHIFSFEDNQISPGQPLILSPHEKYRVTRGASNATPSKIPLRETYKVNTPTKDAQLKSKSSSGEKSASKLPRPNVMMPPRSERSRKVTADSGARTTTLSMASLDLNHKVPINSLKLNKVK